MVVAGEPEQRADVVFQFGDDRGEPVGAVADAQYREADFRHFEYGFPHLP